MKEVNKIEGHANNTTISCSACENIICRCAECSYMNANGKMYCLYYDGIECYDIEACGYMTDCEPGC